MLKSNKFSIDLDGNIFRDNELMGRGLIAINDFSERFYSPLSFWKVEEYKKSWYSQLTDLKTKKKAFLATTMYDPVAVRFLFGWAIYLEGHKIFFQNRVLFFDEMRRLIDTNNLQDLIENRTTHSEDGTRISEWTSDISAIGDFLKVFV